MSTTTAPESAVDPRRFKGFATFCRLGRVKIWLLSDQ